MFPANSHSIASIPLNKLVPWDGNVRKTGAGRQAGGADRLDRGARRPAVPGGAKDQPGQIRDHRRTQALSRPILACRRRNHRADAPVPCRIVPGSADATEISLTENVVRAPMHPADQFEAFRELIDAGSTVADIAARFGISEVAVKTAPEAGPRQPRRLRGVPREAS